MLMTAAVLAFVSVLPARAHEVTWVQAETTHFRFIFEPRDRPAVDELLTFCEPIYDRITGYFNSYPKKVPVIIRGRIDQANGFSSFLPLRIELYLTAPTDHFLGARTESWLKILLTHELTHYVHATMDRGFFFALSRVFGADLAGAPFFFLPGWMIEGPSTNMETRFTSGGRGRNPLFEMSYEAPVEENRLFSLEQAAYGSSFPPPDRIYVGGYILVDWLLTAYGVDTFRRIMDAYLSFPFFGPWSAIRSVTGKSASEVFADLKDFLSAKYAPRVSIPAGELVTPRKPGMWIHPQYTDRGLYVYHSSQDLFPSLVRFDPKTGRIRVLHAVVNDGFSFTATKDGRLIYLSSMTQEFDDPADPRLVSDLYRLDTETGALQQITRNAHLWQPAVSPDGSSLVAVQGTGPYTRLVSVDPRTGTLRVLFSRVEGNVYTPAFSPDGRRVAFTLNIRGFQDVCVADAEALEGSSSALEDPRLPVTDVNVEAARPVLGPDAFGEYFPSFIDNESVAFSSDRGGSLALYRADLASGTVERIKEDPVAAISAVRDGDSLLYSSCSADGWCLKRTAMSDLAPVRIEPSEAAAYPARFEWTGRDAPEKPFTDWALPLVWAPFPAVTRTGPGSSGVELGLGAIVYGASLLGRTTWLADAAWSFASRQPLADLAISTVLGPFTLNLGSRLAYEYVTDYRDAVVSTVSLGLPLLNESSFDTQKFLSVDLGMGHQALVESAFPFTFADSLSSAWKDTLFVTSGVELQVQRSGGPIDFSPPLRFTAAVQNATLLPVLDYSTPESDFFVQLGLGFPSVAPHQVIRIGVKVSDVLGGPFATYTDSFAVPRGFAGPATRTVPGQALASIDYIAPIALFDQPLAFSFAATGAAFGLHAEGIGRWDNSLAAISVDPSLYVGGDFSLLMNFDAVPFLLVIGVAVRINTSAPAGFDPGRDLGIYVSLGPQSLAGGPEAVRPRALIYR